MRRRDNKSMLGNHTHKNKLQKKKWPKLREKLLN
jgi:hypothetical protein